MAANSINHLTNINFKLLPLAERVRIKATGRPTPPLNLQQQDKVGARNFTRRFSLDIYRRNKWICGCDTSNALFCFPCVLFFEDGMDKTWSRSGFTDLKHLNERMRRHQISSQHINCSTELALLGTLNVAAQFNSEYRQNIIKHNEQVARNRYILKRIINCIKFCGKFELALPGHDEDSQNRGIFRELVDFSSELDTILKEHLNTATVFKGTSRTIQNELLDSMLTVCRQEIKDQIRQSDFVAIQCDETTDVSNQCQMALIVRYLHNGNICERFWTFLKVTDESTDGLAQQIENELGVLIPDAHSKLIAQTYDGANIMGAAGRLQANIKNKYKNAHFLHCYAHQVDLITQKATAQMTKVKVFFANLSSIPSFFSNTTHSCDTLDKVVNRRLPIAATHWNYNVRTVNVVFKNLRNLIECFEELEEKCEKTVTCREAYGLRRILEDPNFVFWLNLFHKIFPHVDMLYNQFHATSKSGVEFEKHMQNFERSISCIRDSIDEAEQATGSDVSKRRKVSPEDKNSTAAKIVCDTIVSQLKKRLSYRGHLEAASLVNIHSFSDYAKKFPASAFKTATASYPMLDKNKLMSELEVIYSRGDVKNVVGCLNTLSWISQNDLEETFSETVKLLKIILTTPIPTTESERCFSTFERIKAFLRNTINEDRLNALAMISVNKDLMYNVNDFDEKVTQHFISAKDRRLDFEYKN